MVVQTIHLIFLLYVYHIDDFLYILSGSKRELIPKMERRRPFDTLLMKSALSLAQQLLLCY